MSFIICYWYRTYYRERNNEIDLATLIYRNIGNQYTCRVLNTYACLNTLTKKFHTLNHNLNSITLSFIGGGI